MHLSLFFTSLLLLAEQTILIYAVLTPNSIIDRVDTAIDDVVNAIDDVAVINASVNLGNELNKDNNDIQGSVPFTATIANSVSQVTTDLTNDLIKYFNALANIVNDFSPSELSAILASSTTLKNGAESFVTAIADHITNTDLSGGLKTALANLMAAATLAVDIIVDGMTNFGA